MPVLFVMWPYAEGDPLYHGVPALKNVLQARIQASYARLAANTGARLVNVGLAWESLHRALPGMNLYHDTNHPSIDGSYLCALMFYRFFSQSDLNAVTYVPAGITPTDAAWIKAAARSR